MEVVGNGVMEGRPGGYRHSADRALEIIIITLTFTVMVVIVIKGPGVVDKLWGIKVVMLILTVAVAICCPHHRPELKVEELTFQITPQFLCYFGLSSSCGHPSFGLLINEHQFEFYKEQHLLSWSSGYTGLCLGIARITVEMAML